MQALILAGGFGTRLAELTDEIPKPLVPIGEYPILLHIMSHFSSYGVKSFVILGGYKLNKFHEYFDNVKSDIVDRNHWSVEIIDSGLYSTTAQRLLAAKSLVESEFFFTYGDGVSDINLNDLYNFHNTHNSCATVTAVRPPPRFGALEISQDGFVTRFKEKDGSSEGWINGGFFCLNSTVFDYIVDPNDSFEGSNVENLVHNSQLRAFRHEGFWIPMDTLRDKRHLDKIVSTGNTPWNADCLNNGVK